MTLNVLDLFSGIGGFSLGLERAGMKTAAFCEIEEFPRRILKKHWPDVPIYKDVRKLTGDQLGTIDVICGGFPCQPFSVAGKQRGQKDDRHLWPEMFRLLQETRPDWLIGENVAGFVSMALDDVLSDLESEGYTAQTFIIPACAVGAIHRRDRCWIVARSNSKRKSGITLDGIERQRIFTDADKLTNGQQYQYAPKTEQHNLKKQIYDVADTDNERLQRQPVAASHAGQRSRSDDKQPAGCGGSQLFRPIAAPTQSAVRHRNNGVSDNVARLKALGNAVVPQIPEMIGRAILSINDMDENNHKQPDTMQP